MTNTHALLYIENDRRIADKIKMFMEKAHQKGTSPLAFSMTVARSIASAKDLLSGGPPFEAVLVDIMLPGDDAGADKVQELEEYRETLLAKWLRSLESRAPLDRARRFELDLRITEIDGEIQALIRGEGGIEILEWLVESDAGRQGKITKAFPGGARVILPVVIVTARGLPDIRERSRRLVLDSCLRYIEKPCLPGEILSAVCELLPIPSL
jgi:CheY-like chemotaxis protein